MQPTRQNRFNFALLFLLLGVPCAAAASGATTWTSSDGTTVLARFVGTSGPRVILEKDGRYHAVPMECLSEASIAAARRLLHNGNDEGVTVNQAAATPAGACRAPLPDRRLAGNPAASGSAATGKATRWVRTTAYSCAESDHARYGSRNALGTPLRYGESLRSAAADWSVFPVGTIFRIKGLPWNYVIDDYGSALVGSQTIDIYHPTLDAMRRWGTRRVEISIVRWGSYTASARILASRTRHEHCNTMFVAIQRRRTCGGRL